MKNLFLRAFPLLILALLLTSVQLGAQVPEFPHIADLTPTSIFDQMIEPVYGALVIVFGYLSAFIPGLKKFSGFYRVLAFALVAGLGFFLFGGDFWKLCITYLLSSGLYDVFLRKLFPSSKLVATS